MTFFVEEFQVSYRVLPVSGHVVFPIVGAPGRAELVDTGQHGHPQPDQVGVSSSAPRLQDQLIGRQPGMPRWFIMWSNFVKPALDSWLNLGVRIMLPHALLDDPCQRMY